MAMTSRRWLLAGAATFLASLLVFAAVLVPR